MNHQRTRGKSNKKHKTRLRHLSNLQDSGQLLKTQYYRLVSIGYFKDKRLSNTSLLKYLYVKHREQRAYRTYNTHTPPYALPP